MIKSILVSISLLSSVAQATQLEMNDILEVMDNGSIVQVKQFVKATKLDSDNISRWSSKTETYEMISFGQFDYNGMVCKNVALSIKSGAWSSGAVCNTNGQWSLFKQNY
jgi:hypothetical protein